MIIFSYRAMITIEAIDFLLERSVTLFLLLCPIDIDVIEGNSKFDFNWFQLILIDRTAVARRTMRVIERKSVTPVFSSD